MDYLRGLFISGCIALAGAGGAVIAFNLHTVSPRLMAVGIASAAAGILAGGLTLGHALRRGA